MSKECRYLVLVWRYWPIGNCLKLEYAYRFSGEVVKRAEVLDINFDHKTDAFSSGILVSIVLPRYPTKAEVEESREKAKEIVMKHLERIGEQMDKFIERASRCTKREIPFSKSGSLHIDGRYIKLSKEGY